MNVVRYLLAGVGVFVAAAAAVVIPGGIDEPAVAAACSGDSGVTVVVDYAELGGLQVGCAPGAGGQTANTAFAEAGFPLSHVDRGPGTGMVCKVAGAPADASCTSAPPADAYWSLWHASPTSGTWSYASRGVTQLTVVDGGYVAFAWHQGSSRALPPAVAPRRSHPTARPSTAAPTPQPGERPKKPTNEKPSASPSPRPTTPPTTAPTSAVPAPGAEPVQTPSPPPPGRSSDSMPSAREREAKDPRPAGAGSDPLTVDDVTQGPPEDGSAVATNAEGTPDGLPWWVPVVVVALVVATGGAVAARRR